jgi:hypothetical protein
MQWVKTVLTADLIFVNTFKEGTRGRTACGHKFWSNGKTFMLSGVVKRRSCMYCSSEKPNVYDHRAVNLPLLAV